MLMKVDSRGQLLWKKEYSAHDREVGMTVVELDAGGFVMAIQPSYLLGTDALGNQRWKKDLGGSDPTFLLLTQNNNLVIGGSSSGDVMMVKTYQDGNSIWQKLFGEPSNYDAAYTGTATADGGFLFGGTTSSYGEGDYSNAWLLKLDIEGNKSWDRTYHGNGMRTIYDIEPTPDGSLFLCGLQGVRTHHNEGYVMKTDSEGSPLWEVKFAFTIRGLVACDDGGVVCIGFLYSSLFGSPDNGLFLLKLDSNGKLVW